MDNDGDLDLLLGNSGANRLYANDGDLDLTSANFAQPNRIHASSAGPIPFTSIWNSPQADYTHSIAWGDSDGEYQSMLILLY